MHIKEQDDTTAYFYFVRHGESEANVSPVYRTESTPLTERGREQARFLGKRLRDLPLEYMVVSTMQRAQETAQIINEELSLPFESSDLIVERRRPSELDGKERGGPEEGEVIRLSREQAHDPSWHYSDEENGHELLARSKKALDYLSEMPQKHVLVVTHGLFLRTMLGALIYRDFHPGVPYFLSERMRHANTGVTIFTFHPVHGWRIVTWNDYSHLPA